jgi:hypothetical protein
VRFPRHRRRIIGQLVDALAAAAGRWSGEVGIVPWLQPTRR